MTDTAQKSATGNAVKTGPEKMAKNSSDPSFPSLWVNNLELRLAASDKDLDAVQGLRYRVFYEEMQAKASAETLSTRRDVDRFDDVCDHILVVDHQIGEGADAVVGTYRLLRSGVAKTNQGFYSAGEFDIACLENVPGEKLELGRSCVDIGHRDRSTMQLLWRGIAQYVFAYDIELIFGCGSLPGTDPDSLAQSLSYLYQYHLAPPALRPRALEERYVDMNIHPVAELERRAAMASLPPLIKGYLRIGALVGDGAVVDHQFNSTDVCIVIKTELVTERYFNHYNRAREARVGDAVNGPDD